MFSPPTRVYNTPAATTRNFHWDDEDQDNPSLNESTSHKSLFQKPDNLRAELVATLLRGRRSVNLDSSATGERSTVLLKTESIVDPATLPSQSENVDIDWTRMILHAPDHVDSDQSHVPMLVATKRNISAPRPALVLLHGTGKSADVMAPNMAQFASLGMLVVAPDARHHGHRCTGNSLPLKVPESTQYQQALVAAWASHGATRPFGFDTAADMFYVADYLETRQDVSTMAICGVSLGGIHAWFAAAADTRWSAAVPLIGVQNFSAAARNNRAHARVAVIPHVFRRAAEALLGKKLAVTENDLDDISCPEVVISVWDRICPGLLDKFDADKSLPLIAPRPLFVGNGRYDDRCPVVFLDEVFKKVQDAYKQAGLNSTQVESFLQLRMYDCGHEVTEEMWHDVIVFLQRVLLQSDGAGEV